ncbi:DUF2779 domain-containing protein [Candidatus Gracilibacteria bacterium]|nr:DUF2779 domain-containing protein [Candidatus Gracilibacteria bacterium]
MITITKSLFVDYCEFPKLAWWKHNDLNIYNKIMGLEDEESSEQLIELGQKVEDLIGNYFLKVHSLSRLDVFKDNNEKNPLNEEDEDIRLVQETYKEKRDRNIKATIEAIKNKEKLIYQPGFLIDGLFIRGDYLKLNQNGKYDLIEVKAKTGVRKDKIFKKVKNKNTGNLENRFLSDMSFQKYVINKVLKSEGLEELNNYYYAYLNSDYKKNGDIELEKIVVLDQVDIEKIVILKAEDDEKEETIQDYLTNSVIIEEKIKLIRNELILSEEEFNRIHPFSGSKSLEYFGIDRQFGTIFGKGLSHQSAVRTLYYNNKLKLDSLDLEDKNLFNTTSGEEGSARKYIENYFKAKNEGDLIYKNAIEGEFVNFRYPICFYDYESCSVPIPFLNGVTPYQHAVVQYSLHKVYEDGKIEHFGGVLVGVGDRNVEKMEIEHNENKVDFESEKIITGGYKDLIEEFLNDIGDDLDKTFIVWYSPFENTRNKEIAETFPEFRESFELINTNTYDLMDIFKKGYYYSLDFKGSNSIKYVLPALIPEMSYDGMEVPNGLVAMQVLNQIISGEIQGKEKEKQIKNLLLYCGQDSLAMYKIYEKIKEIF